MTRDCSSEKDAQGGKNPKLVALFFPYVERRRRRRRRRKHVQRMDRHRLLLWRLWRSSPQRRRRTAPSVWNCILRNRMRTSWVPWSLRPGTILFRMDLFIGGPRRVHIERASQASSVEFQVDECLLSPRFKLAGKKQQWQQWQQCDTISHRSWHRQRRRLRFLERNHSHGVRPSLLHDAHGLDQWRLLRRLFDHRSSCDHSRTLRKALFDASGRWSKDYRIVLSSRLHLLFRRSVCHSSNVQRVVHHTKRRRPFTPRFSYSKLVSSCSSVFLFVVVVVLFVVVVRDCGNGDAAGRVVCASFRVADGSRSSRVD